METYEEYNGWRNYETWVVNLWLTNDEVSYNSLYDLAKETPDKFALSQILRVDTEERFYDLRDNSVNEIEIPGMFQDLLMKAIGRVDWLEVAEHAIEMLEE